MNQELVLEWSEDGEDYALHAKVECGVVRLDAQQRRHGKVVSLRLPPDLVEDFRDWVLQAARAMQQEASG